MVRTFRSLFFGGLAMLAAAISFSMPASALDREVGIYGASPAAYVYVLPNAASVDAILVDERRHEIDPKSRRPRCGLRRCQPAADHLACRRRQLFAHRSASCGRLTLRGPVAYCGTGPLRFCGLPRADFTIGDLTHAGPIFGRQDQSSPSVGRSRTLHARKDALVCRVICSFDQRPSKHNCGVTSGCKQVAQRWRPLLIRDSERKVDLGQRETPRV